MAATAVLLDSAEIDLAVRLLAELHQQGRAGEAALVRKLIKRTDPRLMELLDEEAWSEADLGEDEKQALATGLAQIEAGKVVPHDVVMQGKEAVREYRRRRDAGLAGAPHPSRA
jgi:hypothetical protein